MLLHILLLLCITLALIVKCDNNITLDGPIHDHVAGDYSLRPEKGFLHKGTQVPPSCEQDEKNRTVLPYEKLDILELIRSFGYNASEVKVTTEDGYILTLHRIQSGPNSTAKVDKGPVVLWHGLTGSSWSWLFLGKEGLVFQLADQGYDVFMGNVRGNQFSRKHERLSEADPKYWDFSFHEMGIFDVPNSIDTILNITGAPDLYYIGYSLGTIVYSIAVSMRPNTAAKIKTAFLLAPCPIMSPISNPLFVSLLGDLPGQYALIGPKLDVKSNAVVMDITCLLGSYGCGGSCEYVVFLLLGTTSQSNPSTRKFFAKRYPDATATKVVQHMSQMYKTGEFRHFDFGTMEANKIKYNGSDTAPKYPLWNVTTPTVMFWGFGDTICVPSAAKVAVGLWNKDSLKENNRVMAEEFTHLDFIIADSVQSLVYDRVIWLMNTGKYDRNQKFDNESVILATSTPASASPSWLNQTKLP